ncbi:metalloregulator ArsR/SmtB family transcription factor [Phycicoccus sp. SLBN-51]|uniref:ArsR/SmtB family transcription factor n=1 Tax=Phycicoccus sp. SLBN-51 TaxID=2768447 RepID=UPI00336ACCEE
MIHVWRRNDMAVTTITTAPQAVTAAESAAEPAPEPNPESACGGAAARPIPRGEAERRATLLKAVADPARLQLLSIVRGSERGEACVCDMADAVGLTQPTVSHHLKILVEAGLLSRERRGTWAWFALVPERLSEVAGFLD